MRFFNEAGTPVSFESTLIKETSNFPKDNLPFLMYRDYLEENGASENETSFIEEASNAFKVGIKATHNYLDELDWKYVILVEKTLWIIYNIIQSECLYKQTGWIKYKNVIKFIGWNQYGDFQNLINRDIWKLWIPS